MPGLRERIVRMAESSVEIARGQSEHRQSLERNVISNGIVMERCGFGAALFLSALCIGGAFYLAHAGQGIEGIAALVVTLTALVRVFIEGRAKQGSELAKKRQEEADAREQAKASDVARRT